MRTLDPAANPQTARPGLTLARERKLLQLARDRRDPRAAEAAAVRLWHHHLSLIAAVTGRVRRSGPAAETLIAAGEAGLREAIAHFPLSADGTRLASFAIARIRWHVQHQLRRDAKPLPVHARAGFRQSVRIGSWMIAQARRTCEWEGVEPAGSVIAARIAARTGLPPDAAAALAPACGGGPPPEPEDAGGVSRLDLVRARRRLTWLAETFLGERERAVFLARGLATQGAIVPAEQLAQTLGVTPDRIHAIEASARRKIATAAAMEQLAYIPGSHPPMPAMDDRPPVRHATG